MSSEGKFWVCFWLIIFSMVTVLSTGGYIYNYHEETLEHERQIDAQKRIELAISQGVDPIEARCAYYWENKAVCIAAAATRK